MTDALRNIRRGPQEPERVLVLVPGYRDRPEPFLDRAPDFDPAQQWLVVAVEPLHSAPSGPFWYDVDENGPDPVALASALLAIDALCVSLLEETGLGEDDLVLAGFSQGGALALAHLLDPTSAVRPHAVAVLAGYLPSRDDQLIDISRSAHHPVLFAHGEDDGLVEPIRGRSASKAIHRAGGIVTWAEVAGGHQFGQPLTSALAGWLDSLTMRTSPPVPPI